MDAKIPRKTLDELKKMTADEKLDYQKALNRERVRLSRERKAQTETPDEKQARLRKIADNTKAYRDKLGDEYKAKHRINQSNYRKRIMTKEEASSVIQKQFRKNKQNTIKKQEANKIATDILDSIIENSFNKKIVNGELKLKRGRKIK